MATVTRENIGLLNDKIVVKIGQEDYLGSFEKALKNYSRQANIPGFRKGKVPAGMIRKMHGQSVFTDEVLRTVEKELNQYMETEKLDIFAQPLPLAENDARRIDVNHPDEYAFAFEVGLKPDFQVPDLPSQKLVRYKVTVTDEMVNEEVERLRTRHGNMTEPETVSTEDNVLTVTFTPVTAEGQPVEDGAKKDNSLLVKYFAPSFREKLMGLKKGDHVQLQLATAFEAREREWIMDDLGLAKDDPASADAHYDMEITKVGLVIPAELNDTFYAAALPGKTIGSEEEFREAVKAGFQEYWDKQSSNHLQHEIYHLLLDKTHIDFPELLLKRWMQSGGEKPKSQEEVEQEFPSFANQLKWTLITDQLSRASQVEVTPDDIRQFARQQLFSYMGMNVMDEEQPWVADYVNRMMGDRKFVEDTYQRVQMEKLFNWAEGQVNAEEKPISADEFRKELEKHQHHHH